MRRGPDDEPPAPIDFRTHLERRRMSRTGSVTGGGAVPTRLDDSKVRQIGIALHAQIISLDESSHPISFYFTSASYSPTITFYPKGSDERFSNYPGFSYRNGDRNHVKIVIADPRRIITLPGRVIISSQRAFSYQTVCKSDASVIMSVRSPFQEDTLEGDLRQAEELISGAVGGEDYDLNTMRDTIQAECRSERGSTIFSLLSEQPEVFPTLEFSNQGFSIPRYIPSVRYGSGEIGGVSVEIDGIDRIFCQTDRLIFYGEDEAIKYYFILKRGGQATFKLTPTTRAVDRSRRRAAQRMELNLPPEPV